MPIGDGRCLALFFHDGSPLLHHILSSGFVVSEDAVLRGIVSPLTGGGGLALFFHDGSPLLHHILSAIFKQNVAKT